MAVSTPIRLMIADDHDLIHEGIKRVLEGHREIVIVAEATNGDAVLTTLKNVEVDILLLDVSMPGPGFINMMQQLKAKHPRVQVLVLSVHPEDHYALRAMQAGASGYIEKGLTHKELHLAIQTIHAGRPYISKAVHEQMVTSKGKASEAPLHERLSNREMQILLLMGSGNSVSEISSRLFLSPKTVSTHRKRILDKMSFTKNSELIRYCLVHDLA